MYTHQPPSAYSYKLEILLRFSNEELHMTMKLYRNQLCLVELLIMFPDSNGKWLQPWLLYRLKGLIVDE